MVNKIVTPINLMHQADGVGLYYKVLANLISAVPGAEEAVAGIQ